MRFTLLLCLALACAKAKDAPRPPGEVSGNPSPRPVPAPAEAPSVTAAPDAPGEEEPIVGEAPESNPTSETVTIKLVADPARKARVFWGRKDLGLAPLELTRPRGSGPLDLVVVTPGALTLHTRVFTDRDDKLALRLYAVSEAPGILGYREEPAPAPTAPSDAAKRRTTPR